jgi:hypothetical protein
MKLVEEMDERELKERLKMGIDSLDREQVLKFIELIRAILKLQGGKID